MSLKNGDSSSLMNQNKSCSCGIDYHSQILGKHDSEFLFLIRNRATRRKVATKSLLFLHFRNAFEKIWKFLFFSLFQINIFFVFLDFLMCGYQIWLLKNKNIYYYNTFWVKNILKTNHNYILKHTCIFFTEPGNVLFSLGMFYLVWETKYDIIELYWFKSKSNILSFIVIFLWTSILLQLYKKSQNQGIKGLIN
jgi:hypothetical protein